MNEKQMAIANDNRLLDISVYWESKGNMVVVKDHNKIWDRFTEYKGLVQRGEISLEELEKKVYGTYGVMKVPSEVAVMDKAMNDLKELADIFREQRKQNTNEKR